MKVEEGLVDFFVRFRKFCDQELTRLKLSGSRNFVGYDPENIGWIRVKDENGLYEQYPAFQQKPFPFVDYINLLFDLKENDGKFVFNGFFYWLKDDKQTIGRKTLF